MTRSWGEGEFWFGATPLDDRGRPSRGRVSIEALARYASTLDGDRSTQPMRRLRTEDTARLALVVLVVLVLSMIDIRARFEIPGSAGVATNIVVALVLIWPIAMLLSRRWYRLQRPAALSLDACPACGVSLDAVGPKKDGCTVCPACGSAWKRDRASTGGEVRVSPR
ncbi:MAG: hypothetical protein ACFCBV_07440 [Phycisphaerales bacterium]